MNVYMTEIKYRFEICELRALEIVIEFYENIPGKKWSNVIMNNKIFFSAYNILETLRMQDLENYKDLDFCKNRRDELIAKNYLYDRKSQGEFSA